MINRTLVGNLGRTIVSKVEVKIQGQTIFDRNDADVFLCYQDLWKTTKERKNAVYQGILTEAVGKLRIDAGDKGTASKGIPIGKAFDNVLHSSGL